MKRFLAPIVIAIAIYCFRKKKGRSENSGRVDKKEAQPPSSSAPRPYSPSSSESPGFEFDVFLSFRGEDTRRGFTGHLYRALVDRGVSVFIDSEKLDKGRRIDELFDIIDRCEIFVPIFSKRYADSKWCLMEIRKIVECGRLVIPVFFDVDPSDVRHQTGPFESAFRDHQKNKRLEPEKVSGWRDALKKVGEISGYDLRSEADGHESKLTQIIVKRILSEVNKTHMDVAKYPVGLDSSINDILVMLDTEADDVRIVGIHGMGGIGKTTLAKAIYNRISSDFEASSFISGIRHKQIEVLQEQLIRDTLKDENVRITDVSQGINLIKKRIKAKRVLLVLDDVDDQDQLNALAGSEDWFRKRTRIIITTRDYHLLNLLNMDKHETYQLAKLNPEQSLQLFSYHAFGKDKPMKEYMELSKRVVETTDGLPLALEVFGSLFFDLKTPRKWEVMIEKLKTDQHKKIHERLKVSFDGLDEMEKEIFLDIACFFVGKGKENAIHMWKDCKFYPDITIDVLLHRSLIKISSNKDEFEMHDQIRDMGRQIVLNDSPTDPRQRSRLWNKDDILGALECPEGTTNVKCLMLNFESQRTLSYPGLYNYYWSYYWNYGFGYQPNSSDASNQPSLSTESFAKMSNLRLLHVNNANLKGEFHNFPRELRWFEWQGCPLECLPDDLALDKVVVLDLSESMINQIWNCQGSRTKVFHGLKVLDLHDCKHLVMTPDFRATPCLEKIILDKCESLVKVDNSLETLKCLVLLSMKGCSKLEELPAGVSQLSCLEVLDLDGCFQISSLPEQLGAMKSLKELNLRFTAIKSIPDSIGHLTNLKALNVRDCKSLLGLPNSVGKAKSMRTLHLGGEVIEELPESIGLLENLEVLEIVDSKRLKALPISIGQLKKLRQLTVHYTGIMELPKTIGNLTNVVDLAMWGNSGLTILPSCFGSASKYDASQSCLLEDGMPSDSGHLSSLRKLSLSYSYFHSLPSSIGHSLCGLETLYVDHCENLRSLPQLPSSLINLAASYSDALEEIADVSNLMHLKELKVSGCKKLAHIHGLQNLASLQVLEMQGCCSLSDNLRNVIIQGATFENLEKFNIQGCLIGNSSMDQQISFAFPKGSASKRALISHLDLYWGSDHNPALVHIAVMANGNSVFEITKETAQWGDHHVVYFQENDDIQHYFEHGNWMIQVSTDGHQLTASDIHLSYR